MEPHTKNDEYDEYEKYYDIKVSKKRGTKKKSSDIRNILTFLSKDYEGDVHIPSYLASVMCLSEKVIYDTLHILVKKGIIEGPFELPKYGSNGIGVTYAVGMINRNSVKFKSEFSWWGKKIRCSFGGTKLNYYDAIIKQRSYNERIHERIHRVVFIESDWYYIPEGHENHPYYKVGKHYRLSKKEKIKERKKCLASAMKADFNGLGYSVSFYKEMNLAKAYLEHFNEFIDRSHLEAIIDTPKKEIKICKFCEKGIDENHTKNSCNQEIIRLVMNE